MRTWDLLVVQDCDGLEEEFEDLEIFGLEEESEARKYLQEHSVGGGFWRLVKRHHEEETI